MIDIKDDRVQTTRRFSRTSFVRKCGKISILFSYFTPISVFSARTGVLYQSDIKWSHTSKIHRNKFRREMQPTTIETLPQHVLEERSYSFLARRARRMAERKNSPKTLDDRAVDRIDANVISEGVKSDRPQSITIELGTPVTFVKSK